MLIPVILCGGSGSRLWPVSREQSPKPFIRLPDGESLLQKAFLRAIEALNHMTGSEVYVVANRELFFRVKDEIEEVNRQQTFISYILESVGRNTAAAIASVSSAVRNKHPDATLLVLAADHLILEQKAFLAAIQEACQLADIGKIVTFGIRPDTAETGYGYIEADNNHVIRFVEKPNLETARQYVDSGRFLWNSGMFCFQAETMLEQMQLHAENILQSVQACLARSEQHTTSSFSHMALDHELFKEVPDNSIDYAVMEKCDCAAVVPCDIGWCDIGSWSALGDLIRPDADGNRIKGEVLMHDVKNCSVDARHHVIGLVGVEDLIVVEARDAILVANRHRSQEVKEIYAGLKALGHDSYKTHVTVHRPWGRYTVLEESPGFKVKKILVRPNESLSLQHHHQRAEHWIVVQGTATVVNGDETLTLRPNQSTYIPSGQKHRLVNRTDEDVVIVEVQCGDYLGEDDIVRHEDVYIRF